MQSGSVLAGVAFVCAAAVSAASVQSSDPAIHVAAAKAAAGTEFLALFDRLCVPPAPAPPIAPAAARAGTPARPSGPPPRASWHADPVKVFDNLYFVGQTEYSAWAVVTSAGVILIDPIFDYSVADEVVGGLETLGLDPATIKYVIVSHGHSDHAGGASFLQDRYRARVVVSAEDWDLMDRTGGSWRKPKRDVVAKDGHQVTLGDTTLTLHQTPGHTLGTFSTIIPVRDGAARHTVAYWGGTAFNWLANRAAYITKDRPDAFWFDQVHRLGPALPPSCRGRGRRRAALESHGVRRVEDQAAGDGEAENGRSASVRDRRGCRVSLPDRGGGMRAGGTRTGAVGPRCGVLIHAPGLEPAGPSPKAGPRDASRVLRHGRGNR